ncbi:MAG: hypothetical protein K0R27_4632 [Xanthobacteraceae bacterium]|jgi:hypothetical protein|nr:hypothetical protein [Xanthobacteraceae bacterium]
MARALLAFGLLADGACLALLIGIAGFVFEGPEGARSHPATVALWVSGVVLTVAAVIAALVLWRRGPAGRGVLVAWIPPLLGVAFALGLGEMILPP